MIRADENLRGSGTPSPDFIFRAVQSAHHFVNFLKMLGISSRHLHIPCSEPFGTRILINLLSSHPATFQVLITQFKLTTAFILIGAVLAAVSATPTAGAPESNPDSSPEPYFYPYKARAERTVVEDLSPEPYFYPYKAVSKLFALPRLFSHSPSIAPVNNEHEFNMLLILYAQCTGNASVSV
ncbi:hypothetical protein BS17DRAFT_882861 [Gyrodon lividus]|nr:hypothetical protein BS17DRAFT_882861 [Gyrodon lividus]